MNAIEILYDHYKETIDEIKKQENKRNNLFIIVLLHIFVLFLIFIKPESMCNTISDLLMGQWKIGFYFSINIVQIVLMTTMLYCVIRYYQINIQIDKTYPYIHKIEEELSAQISNNFGREGKNYLSHYPKTQNIVYYSYKYIFPILFIIALIYRLVLNNTWYNPIVKIAEGIITIILIILNIVYVIDTYQQE
ncbi:MAG: hypothetical protein J6J60_02320 [Clostridia bacterium]|nr:hypothetical protein [Clostridia bacterium]